MFRKLFTSWTRLRKTAEPPSHYRYAPHYEKVLNSCREDGFVRLINCMVEYTYNQDELQQRVQQEFHAIAMDISNLLRNQAQPDHNIQSHAAQMAEEARQKAHRRFIEIAELAESVLIDQRNHLLAQHINERAEHIGLSRDGPFSGIDTKRGSPCSAFTYKLAADSSLKRGLATGLLHDSIQRLGAAIHQRAQYDIQQFLAVYYQEGSAV